MTRGRRDRLATALRHFGLVDRFGLGALLDGGALPTEAALARRIGRLPDVLPRGITPAYLARFVAEELADTGEGGGAAESLAPLSHDDVRALAATPPGRKAAGRYHDIVFRILSHVFRGRLVDGKKEVEQFQGRKRFDIGFRNDDRAGFFAELVERNEVKAPWIVIECKNYSGDLDNPEFDQLAGRMNDRVGRFGILTVRAVEDRDRMEAHRRDRRPDAWILVLDDADLAALVEAHLRGEGAAVDALVRERFNPLVFD